MQTFNHLISYELFKLLKIYREPEVAREYTLELLAVSQGLNQFFVQRYILTQYLLMGCGRLRRDDLHIKPRVQRNCIANPISLWLECVSSFRSSTQRRKQVTNVSKRATYLRGISACVVCRFPGRAVSVRQRRPSTHRARSGGTTDTDRFRHWDGRTTLIVVSL